MIRGIIQEELIKNNQNLEKLKRCYQIYFDEFNGQKEYTLLASQKDIDGLAYISIEEASNFKIFVDKVCVASLEGSSSKVVSLLWDKVNTLTISGNCKNLKILLTNVSCEYAFNKQVLPLNNSILIDRGDYQLLSYSSYDNIINNSLSLLRSFDNVYSIQSVMINNTTYIACLYLLYNKVYLCTNMNNYNDAIWVTDEVDNIVIVPKVSGGMYAVYIKENKLYYKEIANDLSVGEETLIEVYIKHNPIRLENVSYYSFSMEIFAVKWSNNTISIYQNNGDEFVLITTIKSENSTIFVSDTNINIVIRNKNKITLNKYTYVISGGEINLTFYGSHTLRNVNDCLKIDNYFLFEKDGEYLAIEESNI